MISSWMKTGFYPTNCSLYLIKDSHFALNPQWQQTEKQGFVSYYKAKSPQIPERWKKISFPYFHL